MLGKDQPISIEEGEVFGGGLQPSHKPPSNGFLMGSSSGRISASYNKGLGPLLAGGSGASEDFGTVADKCLNVSLHFCRD